MKNIQIPQTIIEKIVIHNYGDECIPLVITIAYLNSLKPLVNIHVVKKIVEFLLDEKESIYPAAEALEKAGFIELEQVKERTLRIIPKWDTTTFHFLVFDVKGNIDVLSRRENE